jgi:TPP-dependent 2-oxoacid decarboxylase
VPGSARKAQSRKAQIENWLRIAKRQEADQTRKQELNEARVRLTNAKAANQELDTDIRSMIQAPLPGNVQIPFDLLKSVFTQSLEEVTRELQSRLLTERTGVPNRTAHVRVCEENDHGEKWGISLATTRS